MTALQSVFDALDAPLKPIPLFAIEPKDGATASEIERQTRFLGSLRIAAPQVIAWAVPNGHNRGLKDRAKAKKEGLRAGVPDLTIVWDQGVAFLEFKNGTDSPDENQTDLLNYLQEVGHFCAVVRTPQFAMGLLEKWGALPPRCAQ